MKSYLSLILLLSICWLSTGSTAVEQNLSQATHIQLTTQMVEPHPLGYDSAAEFLMRHLALQINAKDMTTVELDRTTLDISSDPNIRILFEFYQKILNDSGGLYLVSPFNVFVQYSNSEKTRIDRIFVDPSMPIIEPLRVHWQSQLEMVQEIGHQISRVLKTGQYKIHVSYFDKSQKNLTYLLRTNEEGRSVRVVGVDQNFEQFLLQKIKVSVADMHYELKDAYYFGSRVMTRDKIIELNPEIAQKFPVQKGMLVKNSVRERGLTNISDLELFLVVTPSKFIGHLSSEEIHELQTKIRDSIRVDLNSATRRFPFGLKVLIDSGGESFQQIQNYLVNYKKWIVSSEQYVRFYSDSSKVKPAPYCKDILLEARAQ